MKKFMERIEEYKFECEAGSLEMCSEWVDMKKRILALEGKGVLPEKKNSAVIFSNTGAFRNGWLHGFDEAIDEMAMLRVANGVGEKEMRILKKKNKQLGKLADKYARTIELMADGVPYDEALTSLERKEKGE